MFSFLKHFYIITKTEKENLIDQKKRQQNFDVFSILGQWLKLKFQVSLQNFCNRRETYRFTIIFVTTLGLFFFPIIFFTVQHLSIVQYKYRTSVGLLKDISRYNTNVDWLFLALLYIAIFITKHFWGRVSLRIKSTLLQLNGKQNYLGTYT